MEVNKIITDYMNQNKYFKDEIFENGLVNVIKRDYEKNKSYDYQEIHPIWTGLKVTGKCNFKCSHCWADLHKEERSLEDLKLAVDKFQEIGIKHITISGGEPFLRSDLIELVEYIKTKGFHLSIFTNASLITYTDILKLEEILDDIDVIQVSLDGSTASIFKAQRNTDLFQNVIKNIELLGKSCITIRINMVASIFNVNDVVNVYRLCEKYNVDTFSISYVYDLNKGKNIYADSHVQAFLLEIAKCIVLSRNYKTKFKPFIPLQFYSNGALSEKQQKETDFWNYDLLLYRFINDKGDMYPEVSLEFEALKIGNIYENTSQELLNKSIEIGNKLKVRNLGNTECKFCDKIEICRGGDMGRTYRLLGDINKKDPYCQKRWR